MAYSSQTRATMYGKKSPSKYTDMINAQIPFLLDRKRALRADLDTDKALDIGQQNVDIAQGELDLGYQQLSQDEKNQASMEGIAERDFAARKSMQEQQEKQAKQAMMLGAAQTGATIYLGKKILDAYKGTGTLTGPSIFNKIGESIADKAGKAKDYVVDTYGKITATGKPIVEPGGDPQMYAIQPGSIGSGVLSAQAIESGQVGTGSLSAAEAGLSAADAEAMGIAVSPTQEAAAASAAALQAASVSVGGMTGAEAAVAGHEAARLSAFEAGGAKAGTEGAGLTLGSAASTAALVYGGAKILEATDRTKEVPKEVSHAGEFVADVFEKPIGAVIDAGSDVIGTWYCTEVASAVKFDKETHILLKEFMKYSKKNHRKVVEYYLKTGPEVVKYIYEANEDNPFIEMYETLVKPVIVFMKTGEYEKAYQHYAEFGDKLCHDYTPHLVEEWTIIYRNDTKL